MKNIIRQALRKNPDIGRPDYYITPTHDFTKYTRDCAEKYWNKETSFNWNQNVRDNLANNLENLNDEGLLKVVSMTLPMIQSNVEQKIRQLENSQLPIEEDALKDFRECITFDKTSIDKALFIQQPLKRLQSSEAKCRDQLEILKIELLDIREQQRLGLFKEGSVVRYLQGEAERQEQAEGLVRLTKEIKQLQTEQQSLAAELLAQAKSVKEKITEELHTLKPSILADLHETKELIEVTLRLNKLPVDAIELARLKDLMLKRQMRGLKDIANHALVVEQSAIAPLTMGIIHYKRHREIQEAMTTFINDEAKHSATFRRFLVEKLEAREYISALLIKGANRYMWLARFLPGTGLFLAVIVEAIGAAYLEFFGEEKYMPDNLFCSICKTISMQDERRHMDLCVAMYNELFRKGDKWERVRNTMALKVMMKSVYGDKTDDHHLIQAFRAFGVESETLYQHIFDRLSQQLARISLYVQPAQLLAYIGRN